MDSVRGSHTLDMESVAATFENTGCILWQFKNSFFSQILLVVYYRLPFSSRLGAPAPGFPKGSYDSISFSRALSSFFIFSAFSRRIALNSSERKALALIDIGHLIADLFNFHANLSHYGYSI